MASIILNGDTSGAITLAAPAVAGTNTVTIPAATGTVMVSGNMPAFSATASANQTITNATNTKIQFNTKTFDTASAFDNTTNYRFTPLVAGYYQVTGTVQMQSNATGPVYLFLYKNGSSYTTLSSFANSVTLNNVTCGSLLMYLNGSTDYIELYVSQSSGTSLTLYGTAATGTNQFSAALVRAA